jgi:hypothetical protein
MKPFDRSVYLSISMSPAPPNRHRRPSRGGADAFRSLYGSAPIGSKSDRRRLVPHPHGRAVVEETAVTTEFSVSTAQAEVPAGETALRDTPALRPHSGTQPDLYLCWNSIPRGAGALDVAVHLHGFSRAGRGMELAEKVAAAGFDLSERRRPTLALLPRGNWLRYSWYDFPALLEGGIDRLVDYAVGRFAAAAKLEVLAVDRLILTAHSGGGMPAVDAIAGARRPPDEFFVFDGFYGRDPGRGAPMQGLEVVDRWLAGRLAAEPGGAGALRVVYIEQQTGPFSREVGALIERRLTGFVPALVASLRRRYRVEPSGVPHAHIARRCHRELLADAAADFDWGR